MVLRKYFLAMFIGIDNGKGTFRQIPVSTTPKSENVKMLVA